MTLFELVGKIIIKNKDANDQLDETTGRASKASDGISSAFKKIGGAVATFFAADKIKDFGLSCINAVSDANAASSQFTQVFGDLEDQASQSLSGIADSAGITETRMKASFTKIASFAKVSGMDTESALSLSERAMIAVADSAAFYDRTLEETTESLQSFLKGNFENDAALGLSCTETTRNAAANELYGKSFNKLSEAQKQLTLLKMVEDANAASGALGQAARESETWTNQTGNLKQAWTDFQAALGQPIIEYAVSACGWLAEKVALLAESFSTGTNPVQWFLDKISELHLWFTNIAFYANGTLRPALAQVKEAFNIVKDAVQPLIDKLAKYFTSGQVASDITNAVKGAIDLLAAAYEGVVIVVTTLVTGWQEAVTWAQQHKTATSVLAIAIGTLTAAVVAYNVAQAIKNAGGIVELAQLAALAVGLGALTVAETAHTVATTIATAATTAFNAALAFLTSPITLVVVAIGALIAIGVALYQNWDVIKEKCAQLGAYLSERWNAIKEDTVTKCSAMVANLKARFEEIRSNAASKFESMRSSISLAVSNAKSTAASAFESMKSSITTHVSNVFTVVQEKFNAIKDAITNKMTEAKNAVQNIINTIKGIFDAITLKLNIKIPKVSVSGGEAPWGIGGQGSLPSFSVTWYKKAMDNAMILQDPTIFGYSNGKMLGAGEAGNEVVAGEAHLLGLIGQVVESKTAAQNERIIGLLSELLDAMVGGNERTIAALMSDRTFSVGEREFGRLVRSYAR